MNLPTIDFHGLTIAIENFKGDIRFGPGWSNKMPADYGYILNTKGADGDEMDCYLGPDPSSTIVFVVDQNRMNGSGSFDEHKSLLGYRSMLEARRDYYKGHSYGYAIFRSITAMPLSAFKTWLSYGDMSRPLSKFAMYRPLERMRHRNYRFTSRKLNPDQVNLVRQTTGKSKQDLARELGVSYSVIYNIKSYKTFRDEAG